MDIKMSVISLAFPASLSTFTDRSIERSVSENERMASRKQHFSISLESSLAYTSSIQHLRFIFNIIIIVITMYKKKTEYAMNIVSN